MKSSLYSRLDGTGAHNLLIGCLSEVVDDYLAYSESGRSFLNPADHHLYIS